MEHADLLRALYLGAAKDCVGSVMLDVVQYDERFAEISSLEEGLQALCSLFHSWAEENHMDKSIIDEIRTLSAEFAFSMKGFLHYYSVIVVVVSVLDSRVLICLTRPPPNLQAIISARKCDKPPIVA